MNRSPFALALVSAAAVVAAAAPARAQTARPAWTRFLQHQVTLAKNLPEVQAELKLTDDQKKKIDELDTNFREERQAIFQSSTPGEWDWDQIRKDTNKLSSETTEELNKALDKAQQKRLQEIYLQVNGAVALQDEAVAKELGLSDEQKTKLDAAIDEARTTLFASFGDLQGLSPEDADAKREAMAKERDDSYLAVLTPEQTKKFDELKGAEFKVDLSQMPNPFGG